MFFSKSAYFFIYLAKVLYKNKILTIVTKLLLIVEKWCKAKDKTIHNLTISQVISK